MPNATIKLFLVNGEPKRVRTAELSNWTGKAVAGPRSEFDSVLAREESQKSGVYFLTGNDPESGKPAVYIGEAECVRDRLKSQLREVETKQRLLETELKALRQSEIRSKREIEALSTLIELNESRGEAVENANP